MNTGYEPSGEDRSERLSASSPNYPVIESPSVTTPLDARNIEGFFVPGQAADVAVAFARTNASTGTLL
jgi:hypothetical protein